MKKILPIVFLISCVGVDTGDSSNNISSVVDDRDSGVVSCEASIEVLEDGKCNVRYESQNGGLCMVETFDAIEKCEQQVEETPVITSEETENESSDSIGAI